MIPPAFIQQLLDRADIVALIGREVQLKKAGINLLGLCPFHREKTPSFTVNPTKQFFHCFGCGEHGTALGWVMKRQNLGFVPAVQMLAEQLGMTVPQIGGQWVQQDPSVYQCLQIAAQFFQSSLNAPEPSAKIARDYLQSRKINAETIRTFQIGYAPGHAPANATALRQALSREGMKDEEIAIRAGLLIRRDNGQIIERFRHRLIVPIIDRQNRVVGFGGRTLGEDEPKYLNSPETEVFHKGRQLFGLPQAHKAIVQEGTVIVVEGYFDAMALAQHDIRNVVASMGTAMTEEQINRLWSLAHEIILCFDGDLAGVKATWRAIERLLPTLADGQSLRIVTLPENLDPDDMVRTRGVQATRAFLQNGKRLSELLIGELQAHFDGSTEGKSALVKRASAWLSAISNDRAPIFRQDLMGNISRLIGLPLESILHSIPAAKAQQRQSFGASHKSTARTSPQQERWLLIEALSHPDCVHDLLAGVINPQSEYTRCLQWIADRYDEGVFPSLFAAQIEWLKNEGFGELIEKLISDIMQPPEKQAVETDIAFRRGKVEADSTKKQKLMRFNALCQQHQKGTISEAEKQEMKELLPQLRDLHLAFPNTDSPLD